MTIIENSESSPFKIYDAQKIQKYLDEKSEIRNFLENIFFKFSEWIDKTQNKIVYNFKRKNSLLTENLFLLVIVNLVQSAFNEKTLSITRDKRWFEQTHIFCQRLNISLGDSRINFYNIWISIFKFMKDEGFTKEIAPHWSVNKIYSRQGAVYLTDKGENILMKGEMLQLPLKNAIHSNDLLAFTSKNSGKNSQKIDNKEFLLTEEYKRKEKKLILISDYFESLDQSIKIEDTLTSKSIIDYLLDLIFKNQVYVIDFKISVPEDELTNFHQSYSLLKIRNDIKIKINDDKFIIEKIHLEILNKIPKRIFCHCNTYNKTKCFIYGGRLYSQTFSNLKRELRKNFFLGNEVLKGEFDFASLHPRMLFYLSGVNPPDNDLYSFELCTELAEFSEETQRKLVKIALLVAINSTSYVTATCGFKKEIRKNLTDLSRITDQQLNLIFNNVINDVRFDNIRDYLFTNKGIELQCIDSDMITDSLVELIKQNIPTISLHDSLFFTTRNEDKMKIIKSTLDKNYVKHLTKALKKNGISIDVINKLTICPDLKFKAV